MKATVKQITSTHKGLFADANYRVGQIVAKIEGAILDTPNRFTYQVAPNKHISCDNELKYINHHCYPNLKVENENLVCIKAIETGDELTFDYNSSEDRLDEPFECACCGKLIKGKHNN